jgi:hypothetical protein
MAWVIIALVPDRSAEPGPDRWWGEPSPTSRKLALYYAIGAAVCSAAAIPGGAWLWFGWPASALWICALAYFTANPRFLQKCSGSPSPPVEWILLPVLLAARLYQSRWLGTVPAWREVAPGVFFGRRLTAPEAREFLRRHPCCAVIDLTAEAKECRPFIELAQYHPLPVLDLTLPAPATLRKACEIIRAEHARGAAVYIHCLLGLGRSAYIAAAWLIDSGRCHNAREAVELVRTIDPRVVLEEPPLRCMEPAPVLPQTAPV